MFWEDHQGQGITWLCKIAETVSCALLSPFKTYVEGNQFALSLTSLFLLLPYWLTPAL